MPEDAAATVAQLEQLLSLLETLPDGPAVDGTEDGLRTKLQLVDQLDDYLLPRIRNLDAPLLMAVGGSTGAGKSTLVNTLVGDNITAAGLLRPTTRTPVLVCHPADEEWFLDGEVLPDLPRATGERRDTSALTIRTSSGMQRGLAILDTPDIDSVEVANHELAAQLLGAADLWLFVTTAARYADAVPWEYLEIAKERGAALAIVINRIPPGGSDEVVTDFVAMLDEHALGETPVFSIDEVALHDQRLDETAIPGLRSWLDHLAADAQRRTALVRDTVDGALASIPSRVERVADAVDRQAATIAALATIADQRFAEAIGTLEQRLDGGTLLRSEVLARWQEFVGGGQVMQALQAGIGRLRDRIMSAVTGSETVPSEVQGELQSSLTGAILEAADTAADATVEAWDRAAAGHHVLGDRALELARVDPDLRERAEKEIAAWQDYVLGLVREQAEHKRLAARTLSLGINSIGVTLMIVLFAQTGGITGGEVAVAGGTATISQALLTALFGENAVRDLARQSRRDLVDRMRSLLGGEVSRFHELLEGMPTARDAAALRAAAGALARADS